MTKREKQKGRNKEALLPVIKQKWFLGLFTYICFLVCVMFCSIFFLLLLLFCSIGCFTTFLSS